MQLISLQKTFKEHLDVNSKHYYAEKSLTTMLSEKQRNGHSTFAAKFGDHSH